MTTIPFLPPSSRLTRFRRRAARSAMRLPVADEPVNEMTGHVRRVDDRVADLGSPAGDHVDRPGREARLGHQLDDERRAMGRVAGRA